MTHTLTGSLIILACCISATALSASTELNTDGFADCKGGSGGKILRVTNLDNKGPGSLRAAIESQEPRIVIFEVGGIIDLQMNPLKIRNPYITIAGQTAPSPGITLIRGAMYISTHDVLVQHIRVRPGDAGQPKKSGWETDGISTSGGDACNIIIDHCSASWATDENISASGARTSGPEATSHKVTISNCIIAEGLNDSSHAKGPHSKGSLIHDFCQEIAVIGNLYAHNMRRNPYFKAHTTGIIVNNVIYNPGQAAIQLNYSPKEWTKSDIKPVNCRVSIVGNAFYYGENTRKGLAMISPRGDAYMEDNLACDREGKPSKLVDGSIIELKEKPVWPENLKALPAKDVADYVVQHAGARPKDRDAVDKRIIKDFQDRKGRVIDSQDEVGGYPETPATARKLTIPEKDVEGWLAKIAKELE